MSGSNRLFKKGIEGIDGINQYPVTV